jgi:hypothetical protein
MAGLGTNELARTGHSSHGIRERAGCLLRAIGRIGVGGLHAVEKDLRVDSTEGDSPLRPPKPWTRLVSLASCD